MSDQNPIREAIEAERTRAIEEWNPARSPLPSTFALFDAVRGHMAEALAYRMGGPEPESTEAFRWVGRPLVRLVEMLLNFRGDLRGGVKGTHNILHRGIVSGDVQALLQNAGNSVLGAAYQTAGGLVDLCRRASVRDFKDRKSIQVGGDAGLVQVTEAGPYSFGSVSASAQTYKIETFGKVFTISRMVLANDDLGAFADLSARLGRMAAEFTAGKVVSLLESNPALSDGSAVFHAAHKNLGSAGALSETTLAELLKLMRAQKGLGDETIAVVPRALVVPSALELSARKLVASLGIPAPLEVVVEPRLTSATAHYVFAAPGNVPVIEYVDDVAGSAGPRIEVGTVRDTDGVGVRVTLDLGVGFVDFRGAAKNAGA